MASEEELSGFIRTSFRSVWSLELLLLLKREPRCWARAELVQAMRASELIVSQSLEALATAGIVMLDQAGDAAYRPASDSIRARVEETESLYARSPDAVRRLIVASRGGGLTAFAEAFRIRKD